MLLSDICFLLSWQNVGMSGHAKPVPLPSLLKVPIIGTKLAPPLPSARPASQV